MGKNAVGRSCKDNRFNPKLNNGYARRALKEALKQTKPKKPEAGK